MAAVLILDDNPDVRTFLRWLLEDAGHTVTEARYSRVVFTMLDVTQHPLVVLLGTSGDDGANAAVLLSAADYGRFTRHRYILLMASSAVIMQENPSALLALTSAKQVASVVSMPDGLLVLQQVVAEAAEAAAAHTAAA